MSISDDESYKVGYGKPPLDGVHTNLAESVFSRLRWMMGGSICGSRGDISMPMRRMRAGSRIIGRRAMVACRVAR